mmetsp:Transcript_14451/g.40234  ORF Transcript_14451/g.40234 Transcript_14451/m.40234 type:complete len:650 (-) Transcript_14451:164-2113(-)
MPSSMGDITAMASGSGMAGSGFPQHQQQQQQQQPQHHHHPLHQAYPSPMDRCAGCGAVDVPLLACDDIDGKGKDGLPVVIDPSQRSRFCANCMIGKKVRVFWPVDNSWYIGTVQQFNAATGEHLLQYEDDDTEWVHIGESNTTMNPSEFSNQTTQLGMVSSQSGGSASRSKIGMGSSPNDAKSSAAAAAGTERNNASAATASKPTNQSNGAESAAATAAGSAAAKGADAQSTAGPATRIDTTESSSSPNAQLPAGYRAYGSAQSAGGAYPPPSSSGQHHLPPHLSHHHSHHAPHGYGPGPGGPSSFVGPAGFSTTAHGHGPPHLGYGYGPHGMAMQQRHGTGGAGPPHHFGGIHGHAPHPHHRLESPASITSASGPAGATNANGKKKTGPKAWTKEEDALLLSIVQSMRIPMKWSLVAQSLPERTGKQCRERYVNHLNPRLKVTDWSPTEDATIFHLYNTIGSHWAKMSKIIPGRTDNGIKNRFHNLRRQLEREDEHRLRLNASRDFPEEIRLDLLRNFPKELRGKTTELWDIKSGLSVLAAQSVLGGDRTRTAGRFGPFREAEPGKDDCVRCGFCLPSVQTGSQICTKTGWCQSCARIPPHVSGNMLRECLNLRRCQNAEQRKIIESWEIPSPATTTKDENSGVKTKQ